jgi:dGTP triphosphohydrolase
MLEGLAKHNGPVGMVPWALAELDAAYPLELTQWGSLEAQVAALADDIAYDNHDIDDGLRAGFLDLEDLLTLDFVADQWRAIETKFPGAPQDRQPARAGPQPDRPDGQRRDRRNRDAGQGLWQRRRSSRRRASDRRVQRWHG